MYIRQIELKVNLRSHPQQLIAGHKVSRYKSMYTSRFKSYHGYTKHSKGIDVYDCLLKQENQMNQLFLSFL